MANRLAIHTHTHTQNQVIKYWAEITTKTTVHVCMCRAFIFCCLSHWRGRVPLDVGRSEWLMTEQIAIRLNKARHKQKLFRHLPAKCDCCCFCCFCCNCCVYCCWWLIQPMFTNPFSPLNLFGLFVFTHSNASGEFVILLPLLLFLLLLHFRQLQHTAFATCVTCRQPFA